MEPTSNPRHDQNDKPGLFAGVADLNREDRNIYGLLELLSPDQLPKTPEDFMALQNHEHSFRFLTTQGVTVAFFHKPAPGEKVSGDMLVDLENGTVCIADGKRKGFEAALGTPKALYRLFAHDGIRTHWVENYPPHQISERLDRLISRDLLPGLPEDHTRTDIQLAILKIDPSNRNITFSNACELVVRVGSDGSYTEISTSAESKDDYTNMILGVDEKDPPLSPKVSFSDILYGPEELIPTDRAQRTVPFEDRSETTQTVIHYSYLFLSDGITESHWDIAWVAQHFFKLSEEKQNEALEHIVELYVSRKDTKTFEAVKIQVKLQLIASQSGLKDEEGTANFFPLNFHAVARGIPAILYGDDITKAADPSHLIETIKEHIVRNNDDALAFGVAMP